MIIDLSDNTLSINDADEPQITLDFKAVNANEIVPL